MRKVLILGGSGFIGRYIFQALGEDRSTVTYNSSSIAGGIYFNALEMGIDDLRINLTDYSHCIILVGTTSPDYCANNLEASRRLNVLSIQKVIHDLEPHGVIPVFTSTEAVFDGQNGQYTEQIVPKPSLVYGQQKREIENYLGKLGKEHLIVRIAKVYDTDPDESSLLTNWLRQIQTGGQTIHCANDFFSSAIHVRDTAEAILKLIERRHSGIFHVGGPHALSYLDMIEALIKEMTSRGLPIDANIVPCSIDKFPTIESRPKNISMNTDKLIQATGIMPWDISMSCCDLMTRAQPEAAKRDA